MTDYIDREAAIKLAKDLVINTGRGVYRHRCIDPQGIRELPAADVKPVIRGRWIISNNGGNKAECPFCKGEGWAWQNFCPNCGADIRSTYEE